MAKPKLTDALKPAATETATATKVAAESQTSTEATTPEAPAKVDAAADPDDADDDDSTDTESSAKPALPAAEAKPDRTLAEYREAFGVEQGSVFWADGMSFADACKKHMAAQQEQLVAVTQERDQFKTKATELANELKGEKEPLNTAPAGKQGAQKDPHESYASYHLERLAGAKS